MLGRHSLLLVRLGQCRTVVRLVVEESSRGSKLAVYTLNCRQLAVTHNTLARCDVESCVLVEFVQRDAGEYLMIRF